jgi:hypothetical protein
LNPSLIACSFCKLWINNPAQISKGSDIAICPMTSALRKLIVLVGFVARI